MATIEAIAHRHRGEEVLVVTHGGVINALQRSLGQGGSSPPLTNLAGRWFALVEGQLAAGPFELLADAGDVTVSPSR